jgi:hypothetical protein
MKRIKAPWTTRRKLLIIENVVFLACMIGGVIFVFTGHGRSHALAGAVFLLVIILIHTWIRQNYFKQVILEIRSHRQTGSE